MHITKSTPRVAREVLGFTVNVPQPYKAGPHELTEGEANSFNQTGWENVRNNITVKIRAIKENADLTDEQRMSAVQKLIDDTFASYQFGVRKGGGRRVSDPVRAEALRLAKDKLAQKFKSQNKELPTKEVMGEMANKLIDSAPAWMEAARKILDQRREIGEKLAA